MSLNRIKIKSNMSFDKVDGVMYFNDYKSFFKFVNNYEKDLIVRKFEVFDGDKLIAVFNHKEKASGK